MMYGRKYGSVLAEVTRSEMGLYEVLGLLFGFGMGMMLASLHMCGMMSV